MTRRATIYVVVGEEYALSTVDSRRWAVAPVLASLVSELDAAFPLRSRVSDGSIGDAAHKARHSDHTPDQHGYVRAVDITADPRHGPDPRLLAEFLRRVGRSGSQRLSLGGYVIFDHHIASERSRWDWVTYTGDNPHVGHLHVSCSRLPHFYCITRPWQVADALERAAAQTRHPSH